MIAALVILSIVVLLLLVALAFGAIFLVDAIARARVLTELLSKDEEKRIRGNELVYQKFGYRVPYSDTYLRIEELKLEESKSKGEV